VLRVVRAMFDRELGSLALGGFAVALGVGLLIGAERERSKGQGPGRAAAGVRTFALVALLGATAAVLESTALAALFGAGVILMAAASYLRSRARDPGITTEVALIVAYALGVLAVHAPSLAGGLGVLVTLLLVSRSRLHDFVSRRLSDQEVSDGILLAAAALIVLPLLPNRSIDPYGVINPQLIWRLTVLVLLINAFGYVALRTLSANVGLAVAGLFGGFVSSAATIGALGLRFRGERSLARPAIAGAALSSAATVVQLSLVLMIANRDLFVRLSLGLVLMGIAAAAYGAIFAYLAVRGGPHSSPMTGRAFQPRFAILFALLITAFLFIAAFLADRYGARSAILGIAFAGFADAHSASASAARLLATGALDEQTAVTAMILAVATNSATKVVVAWKSGGGVYVRSVAPGIVLMLAAFVLGAWISGLI